jgi:DNA-binding MarR family transcriptional regulator
MARMDTQRFAQAFGELYHELYRKAVRRVDDGRERLSNETVALLMHLAQAGPMSLSEMAQHFGRALSTLSAKVASLEADGLLSRQRDGDDARRALIWLSAAGRQALHDARQVLDTQQLRNGAARLTAAQRQELIDGLQALSTALSPTALHPDDEEHP